MLQKLKFDNADEAQHGLEIDIDNKASASGSSLLRFLVNGIQKFRIDLNGVQVTTTIPTTGLVFKAGDFEVYVAAGAPVDYTDGTPPATGETTAGIGSLYVNTTTGKHYVNGGTKAEPLWKIVTSAA